MDLLKKFYFSKKKNNVKKNGNKVEEYKITEYHGWVNICTIVLILLIYFFIDNFTNLNEVDKVGAFMLIIVIPFSVFLFLYFKYENFIKNLNIPKIIFAISVSLFAEALSVLPLLVLTILFMLFFPTENTSNIFYFLYPIISFLANMSVRFEILLYMCLWGTFIFGFLTFLFSLTTYFLNPFIFIGQIFTLFAFIIFMICLSLTIFIMLRVVANRTIDNMLKKF